MASLRSILNPDDSRQASSRLHIDGEAHSPSALELPSSPASVASAHTVDALGDVGDVDQLDPEPEMPPWQYQDHEPHPNCPDTLDCLPDTDGRPQHTLPVILRCAILGSPRKRLTIREIYAAMEGKYAYYKTAGPTWKQSVRHHLSLNRLFERQPRPVTDPGFGSYWTVNLLAPPGTKRPRKRGRPNKDKEAENQAKKRGRPRKDGPYSESTHADRSMHDDDDYEEDGQVSDEDEFESEDDIMHSYERRPSLAGSTHYQLPSTSSSRNPFPDQNDEAKNIIERLQIEVAGLRRQSAEAVSLSIRLTDQLAQAQAEASRSKSTLRTVEAMLEEESRKRREAERDADEEAELRRQAEQQLDSLRMRWSSASRPS
ncbi:hypothetical protein EV421DRAFT_1895150 [Armillaria borealis]|uniref:Fork-head domain-containing protein n=1 Tax=Armillaria borealis TaxID=47425 RepID=A0AA39KBQ3_9AGAR|nr:hypothetical protein EV421DRAFT_1895150 [Armillaria borealis]